MESDFSKIFSILKIPSHLRSTSNIDDLIDLTKSVQFFQKINAEQGSSEIHQQCCQVMSIEEYLKNSIIFNIGDKGDKFYIILKGSVSIKLPSKKQKNLETIEKFRNLSRNNIGLLDASQRTPKIYQNGIKTDKVVLNISNVVNNITEIKFLTEENDEKALIADTEEKNMMKLFKKKLKYEQKLLMETVKQAEKNCSEIEIGEFDEITVLYSGSSFGELALISDRLRSTTVQAKENSIFLVLNKKNFIKILGNLAEKKLNSITQFMTGLSYFYDWSKVSLLKLAYFLQLKTYNRWQFLYHEGDFIDGIYFIKSGEVTLSKKKQLVEQNSQKFFFTNSMVSENRKKIKIFDVKIVIKGKNESVGSFEIIENIETRNFSCACLSSQVEVYFMSKQVFYTRVQNLDIMKNIMILENKRLIERYNKLVHPKTKLETTVSRSLTPTLTSKNQEFIKSLLKNSATKIKIGQSPTKPMLEKFPQLIQRFRIRKINEAINGRPLKKSKFHSKNMFSPVKVNL